MYLFYNKYEVKKMFVFGYEGTKVRIIL